MIVNTCGFLDSAKAGSLAAIGEAMAENGRVIVTGCMGKDAETIRAAHPGVLAVTGPQQYDAVVNAVHGARPAVHDPKFDLLPPQGLKLTPRHYAYLKISEGCNNRCSFCIIPSIARRSRQPPGRSGALRGRTAGRRRGQGIAGHFARIPAPMASTSNLPRASIAVARYAPNSPTWSRELGNLGAWVRLHYVYPYPHVDEVIPLMAEGKILPYLDIPFQHASPRVLKAMRRPANQEKVLDRLAAWRGICPDLPSARPSSSASRAKPRRISTILLDWLTEARLDRVGCFKYEPVAGAAANELAESRARRGQGRALAPFHAGTAENQCGYSEREDRPQNRGARRSR